MPGGATPSMDTRAAIGRVADRHDLTAGQMAEVVGSIMDGGATPAQVGALLVALRMKGETVDEVVGAARAMRARMTRVSTPSAEAEAEAEAAAAVVDVCGTGGDGSGSVNVSTLSSFILAGAGVLVAKHGNRALSSRSGSHDVIEALGLDPAPSPDVAARCLREVGLAFLFAPVYHQATRHAAGPRKEIGVRTLFNLLGPLTNPAGARLHVNGVFSRERCELMARAHGALGSERALVVHGAGGLDELAPAGATFVAELRGGDVRTYEVTPADFGLPEADPAGLRGGDPALNARMLEQALDGAAGASAAIRTAALMAAAAGLVVGGAASNFRTAAAAAAAALDDGRARRVLDRLRALTPRPPA